MDGLVYIVVEKVKKFGYTLRDCFEDKTPLIFQLTGQQILPSIIKISLKMEYTLNINSYSKVIFILEGYNTRKNVRYITRLR
jgi:hypothetical protein